jgi:hypothetical protein
LWYILNQAFQILPKFYFRILFQPYLKCVNTNNINDVLFNYKLVGYNAIFYPLYIHNILFFHSISKIMPTPFLDLTFPVYQCLNLKLSNSFSFSPTHLVSCYHIKLIFLLVTTSTISIYLQVRVPLFHVLKRVLLSSTNLFTHTRSQRFGDPCLFFTASKWRCIHASRH